MISLVSRRSNNLFYRHIFSPRNLRTSNDGFQNLMHAETLDHVLYFFETPWNRLGNGPSESFRSKSMVLPRPVSYRHACYKFKTDCFSTECWIMIHQESSAKCFLIITIRIWLPKQLCFSSVCFEYRMKKRLLSILILFFQSSRMPARTIFFDREICEMDFPEFRRIRLKGHQQMPFSWPENPWRNPCWSTNRNNRRISPPPLELPIQKNLPQCVLSSMIIGIHRETEGFEVSASFTKAAQPWLGQLRIWTNQPLAHPWTIRLI